MESTMIRRFVPLIAALAILATAASVQAETVYFVSKDTGALYQLNTVGGGITPLTGTNTFPNATALAMGPDGNLYVGDATNGGSIQRYAMAGGAVSSVVTLNGAGPAFSGAPVNPGAIAFTAGGTMLVGRNPQVAFFPGSLEAWPAGPVLSVDGWRTGESPSISAFTSGTAQNYSPGLALASNGTLYASNSLYDPLTFIMTGNVLRFDASGAYQGVVAADGSASGGLYGPTGLVVSGNLLFTASTMDGNIYKTDLDNPNTATNTTPFASTAGVFIGPLAMLSDGNLLTAYVGGALGRGTIFRFDTTGSLVDSYGGSEYGAIGGVVAVPEPATITLTAAGAACLALWRLRRRRGA
jgi:sugar lactone lactonase YvrE